jgi:hypothetical protein
MEPAPFPGTAEPSHLRPTVRPRPLLRPAVWHDPHAAPGYPTDHPYVRRFWTAVMGPGAVADLLRLATAAARDRSLPRPVYLATLMREGLTRHDGDRLTVRTAVPVLAGHQVRRLPPDLRREHARWQRDGAPAHVS